MPDLANWYGNDRLDPVDATGRAIAAWRRINDRPASITLYRDDATISAQTVRIEYDDKPDAPTQAVPAKASERELTIFGVVGHPTATDTDIEVGDVFTYMGGNYRVRDVIILPGEVQANAERMS